MSPWAQEPGVCADVKKKLHDLRAKRDANEMPFDEAQALIGKQLLRGFNAGMSKEDLYPQVYLFDAHGHDIV